LLRINSAEGPPDAGRGSPARWFPDKNSITHALAFAKGFVLR
jgi:hypothetical protein